jgi:hypothetical protein
MNNLLLSKLQQFENNIKEYINVKFEEQHRLHKRTDLINDLIFSFDYFIKKESEDPDLVLIEEEDAHCLIDGIIEKFLDWNSPRKNITSALLKFTTINLCK